MILGIFFISVFWPDKKFAVIGFCLIFLVLGILVHQRAEYKVISNEIRQYNNSAQTIEFEARVCQEPDKRANKTHLTVKIEEFSAKVLVIISSYPEYQYGDRLLLKGFLKEPKNFDDFNYQDYLAKDGIYSLMSYPKIELIERNSYRRPSSVIFSKILEIKNKLRQTINQNLAYSQALLLSAITLGDKTQLPFDLKEKLNIVGLRHIVCVSGMHIVILALILEILLVNSGLLSRSTAFYLTFILIWLFIIMIGFQTSAIRAGIMASLLLFAQHIGRLNQSGRAIVFAAVIMLWQNPLLLKSDVGFQLSFLATLGIIYWRSFFMRLFRKIPGKTFLAMTFSAQMFTLPILIYNFGYVSLIAPLTNVLAVPLLPYIMGFGFAFIIFGTILPLPFLSWILSLPVWFLLSYLLKITEIFSQPGLALSMSMAWFWLPVFYLILGIITYQLKERERWRFLDY